MTGTKFMKQYQVLTLHEIASVVLPSRWSGFIA